MEQNPFVSSKAETLAVFFFFFWLGNELLLVINEFLSYLLQTLNSDLMDNIKILCFSQQKFKG